MFKFKYVVNPIDYYNGCMTLGEFLTRSDSENINEILCELSCGMAEMKKLGWEGDIRGDIYVFAIPDDVSMAMGFVWKQDNNGTTFILSKKELPWFERLSI